MPHIQPHTLGLFCFGFRRLRWFAPWRPREHFEDCRGWRIGAVMAPDGSPLVELQPPGLPSIGLYLPEARRLAASLTRLARVGNDPLLRPVVVLGSDGCSTIAGECREGQLRLRLHWRGVDVPMGLSQALATDLGRLLDRIARQADG